ncbi:MAG: hypothetical protein WKG07_14720 [Hymenobacter sp.]
MYSVIGRNNPDVESVITNVAIGAGDPSEATAAGTSQSNLGKVGVAFKELSERTGPGYPHLHGQNPGGGERHSGGRNTGGPGEPAARPRVSPLPSK